MIRPFGKNILIEPVARATVLVSDQGSLCEYGKVIAVGDEVTKIKEGEVVGFLVWGIQKLEVDEKTYYFLPETSEFILCFVEE